MLIIDYISCIISICYAHLFTGWVTLGKSFNILIIVLRVRARVFRMACLSTSSPLPSLAVKPLVTLAFFQVERKPLSFVPESLACVVSLLEEQSFSNALLSQLIAVSLGSDATCLGNWLWSTAMGVSSNSILLPCALLRILLVEQLQCLPESRGCMCCFHQESNIKLSPWHMIDP